MGVLGNPGKYTMVIAENEEASPWEPLHVEHGFNREDSTVAVFFPNSFTQTWPYGTDDKGILNALIFHITRGGRVCLILTPPHARTLASKGWTRKEVAAFISEYARAPAYRLSSFWGNSPVFWGKEGSTQSVSIFRRARMPLNALDSVAIIPNPDSITVLVAGGPGAFMGLVAGGGEWLSQKVELPANWDNLVEKYKNIVPTYARY